jgi:type I restriction enzyme, S subunit
MTLRPEASPRTIGDVCDFESGNGFRPQDWKTKGLPIVRIQNLNGSDSFNYFDGEPDPAWIVEPNDLLFAWAGVKGVSFGPTIWNGPKGVLNQHIYRIRPKKGINKRWLYYALLEVTAEIESKAHGFKTSLVHVRKADITRARISLPGEHEQEAVAKALGCWDTAIQKTEQLIAAKRRHLSALRQRLFMREPGQGFVRAKLETVLTERAELSDGSSPVYSVSVHKGLVNQVEHLGRSFSAATTDHYSMVRPGDIVYTKSPTGEFPFGIVKQSTAKESVIVSPLYGVYRPKLVELGTLVDFFFESPLNATNYLNPLAQKGAKNTISIGNSEFLSGAIPLPQDQDHILRIASFIREARLELSLLERSVGSLAKQKRGLMQKLLTGQWRLPVPKEATA